ncbi:hypothetical protein AAE478_007642 [Parahypoxylon ruwenzoriense]
MPSQTPCESLLSPPLLPNPISLSKVASQPGETMQQADEIAPQPTILLTQPTCEFKPDNVSDATRLDGGKPQEIREVQEIPETQLPDENTRILIKPSDCGDRLGFKWTRQKKWLCLFVVFMVQVSMNFNTTLYSNGIGGISEAYGVSEYEVRWGGAASFLIAYAFGCELWAPWSEEFGRRLVLQSSLLLVNCFAVMAATAPNFPVHILGRTLGGLSTAGGSVTLAVITDLFQPDDPTFQHATNFIVLSSVGGSIIGPIVGGAIEERYPWQYCIWIQLGLGVVVQALHLFIVPETRATVVMNRVAKELRKSGKNTHLFGPGEIAGKKRVDWTEVVQVWIRPFKMFLTEPIVLTFSLLSGFSDALIFMMIQSFDFVYSQWGFDTIQSGLPFLPIGIGYLLAYTSFFPVIRRNVALRNKRPKDEKAIYEARLWWLLFTAPLLPIGLLLFAFTAGWSPPDIHWSGSMLASCMIGIANFSIYMATIDYVLRSYGPYAASATGGNGWARDFLAGILTPYAIPMRAILRNNANRYERLGIFNGTILLFLLGLLLCGAVYIVYFYGPTLRRRSRFAQTLATAEAESNAAIASASGVSGSGEGFLEDGGVGYPLDVNHVVNYLPPETLPGSRSESRAPSASNTPAGSRRSSAQLRRSQDQHRQNYGHMPTVLEVKRNGKASVGERDHKRCYESEKGDKITGNDSLSLREVEHVTSAQGSQG